jgi:PAS domain S-box-containing protein
MSRLRSVARAARLPAAQVLIGLLCTAAVTVLRLVLTPLLGPYSVTWPFYFLAVLVSSLLGGGVGATTTLLSSLVVGDVLFITPRLAEPPTPISRGLSLAVFAVIGAAIGAVAVRVRTLLEDARRHSRLLESEVRRRQEAERMSALRAEELRRVAAQMRIVTESVAAPVVRCSRDFRFVWVNQAYADWRNTSPDKIIGRPIEEVIGAEGAAVMRPYFERVLGGEIVHFEQKLPFLGGPDRWINATYTPTLDAQGECDGWVGLVIDVDERRRAEDSMRDAQRRTDEFLAMLGHELRNPLAAVRNAVAAASIDESQRAAALGIARRQTEQLGRLVDDLLDVARITQGRIGLRREPLVLQSVVQRALESSQPTCDTYGHAMVLDVAREELWVDADATRLEQVLVNLLSNACKYTNPPGRVSLFVGAIDGEAVVRVTDTGIGIAPELLPRVFDLFAQADRSLDRSRGGLGIGLTLAQRIVNMHGGRIEAYSDGLDKGAEFVVRLPLHATQKLRSDAPLESAPPPRTICRVLIIEDSPDAADSLRLLLEVLGQQVRVSHTGEAGLEAMRAFAPQLVLVDIGLPGMDGYEVARRARLDPDMAKVTLVALTGYGRDEDRTAALAAGFDDHLVKPVDQHRLDAVLRLSAR